MSKARLQRWIGPVISLALLTLSGFVLCSQLKDLDIDAVSQSIRTLPRRSLWQSMGFVCLGYWAMTGYDTLAMRHLKEPLAYRRIALTAFISCALSNTIGLSLLTGSAIRYRFYRGWGVAVGSIAQVIAFTNISFWLGLLALSSAAFLIAPLPLPSQLSLSFATARPLGWIMLALLLVYLVGSYSLRRPLEFRGQPFAFPSIRMAIAQITVSALDWGFAAAVLYSLLPPGSVPLSYGELLNVYLLAMAAGVLSNVPGGLGVFETVVILLLSNHFYADALVATLLLYRLIYYLVPFIVAIVLLGVKEWLPGSSPLPRS